MAISDNDSHGPHPAGAAANGWLVVILVILLAVLMFRTVSDTLGNRLNYTPRTVTPRGELGADEAANIAVFKLASPSVVFIRAKGFQPVSLGGRETQELSSGTGIVWDEAGHIITNFHVVRDAVFQTNTQLEVQLPDQSVLDANFVGAVYQHDIAVLKVVAKASQLDPITLGSSDDLVVGQKVLAIGNPFGFDRTLSTGVIGGLNRSVPTEQNNEFLNGLIQTDAAINPGNSGGPLLDSAGRLIGVNTAIVSTSGASAGLGFAVPINNVARSVGDVLEKASQKQTAELGIGTLDRASARRLGIPDALFDRGPIIHYVYPNTAAADAGLLGTQLIGAYRIQLGDQILAIDGRPVRTGAELQQSVIAHAPGETVVLDFIRSGQAGRVEVRLKAAMLLL